MHGRGAPRTFLAIGWQSAFSSAEPGGFAFGYLSACYDVFRGMGLWLFGYGLMVCLAPGYAGL